METIKQYSRTTFYNNEMNRNKTNFMKQYDMLTVIFTGVKQTSYEIIVLIEEWTFNNVKLITEEKRKSFLENLTKKDGRRTKYIEIFDGVRTNSTISYLKYIVVNVRRIDSYERTAKCLSKTDSRLTKSMCICP
ncbi:hypothetical protein SNEBB_010053 [Seison nebaliae]|nr:hypothetical protein SNEBB_010053 [Seison nebaliae]